MPPSVTRETAQPPLQAMEPWEISLWEAHIGTWTSTYTVRDASGALLDEYEAVNEINLDLATNTYAQRNTYTRTKNGERSVETRSYTAYWDGKLMIISGRVLWGTAIASNDASHRVLTLNFFTTPAHPMGAGLETFELITLGANGIDRARTMQHWKDGVLEKVCAVFGEKRVSAQPAIDPYGQPIVSVQSSMPAAGASGYTSSGAASLKLEARNPRTGLVDYSCPLTTNAKLESVCDGLRKAQPAWLATGVTGRAAALMAWADALEARRDALVAALVDDTGRLSETQVEVMAVLGAIRRWCTNAPSLLNPPSSAARPSAAVPFVSITQDTVPYTLVGAISPWNFPLLLALIDAVPALLAGSSMVVKPSEVTPRFVQPLNESIAAVPQLASVFSIVLGGPQLGARLVECVDLVCFTGSVHTGRLVGAAAAKLMVPSFLELGGKDAAVVLAGADIDRAAAAVLWGGCVNGGASCLSIERVYVDGAVHDDFVSALVRRAKAISLAFPTPGSGEIGPIIFAKQASILERHINDAVAKGAKVLCGGKVRNLGGGLYCEPTVLTNCDHSMAIMTEETFGPLLPVMRFSPGDTDAAIGLANDSAYGLSGAVFGPAEKASAVASAMRCGAISINDAALTAMVHDGEKASFGLSGVGPASRMGDRSIARFFRPRALLTNTPCLNDPWWFKEPTGDLPSEAVLLRMLCEFLTGDFDNSEQVAALDAEAASGGAPRTHPYAKHVTRVVNGRMANLPPNLVSGERGIFLLEESDYLHPATEPGGQPSVEVKPLLLFFEPRDGAIWLTSYRFAPEAYEGAPRPGVLRPDAAEAMRNASVDLVLDYKKISPSPSFAPAKYTFDAKSETFKLEATVELGGGMSFSLKESLCSEGLSVMEQLSKDGKPIGRYHTPIEYRRMIKPTQAGALSENAARLTGNRASGSLTPPPMAVLAVGAAIGAGVALARASRR